MISCLSRLARLEKLLPAPQPPLRYARYRNDPCGFARDVLGESWTPAQQHIAKLLLKPPYRVLVKSANTTGKTHLAAGVTLWWHLTRQPSIVLTTAPKLEQVRDLLWKEIRRQGQRHVAFAGARFPRIDRGPDDFCVGTTARNDTGFQGHHGGRILFVFDEAVGVDPEIWRATETMFAGKDHAWLCIFNPTDSSSAAYNAEMARDADGKATWHVVPMDALSHPNITAELAGQPPPVPHAIRLARLNDLLAEWCDPVTDPPDRASDIEWPPGSGRWLHPGPLAEARLLGRWPSQTTGVWSDALWRHAQRRQTYTPEADDLVIGSDVARFGDDCTTIHVRLGCCSLHHEAHNGWGTDQTAGRLKQLCVQWAAWVSAHWARHETPMNPRKVAVHIDDDGVGGGVVDQGGDYSFVGVSAAAAATRADDYPNRRSELWFATASRARTGQLDLSRLPQSVLDRLRQQLMAPVFKLDAAGRRVVEPKDITKKKLSRSPDDADGMNLAYWSPLRRFVEVPDLEDLAKMPYGRR